MKATYQYRQFSWGWLHVGLTFDPRELGQVRLGIDLCAQHREFMFNIFLFGLGLDLFITEPVK